MTSDNNHRSDDATNSAEPRLFPLAGDVRSDPATISALRQGVEIAHRLASLEMTDHRGDKSRLPLLLTERTEGGRSTVSIELATAAISECEKRAAGPRRRSGLVTLGSVDSLIAYVNRYQRAGESVAFAPNDPASVTVIFDYHPPGGELAAWREDRALYSCQTSTAWDRWLEKDEQPMTQTDFGDFIDANSDDLGPGGDDFASAPDLLRVARELSVISRGEFSRKLNPATGESSLVVKDEHDTKSTKIPRGFRLAIPVFDGDAAPYAIEARIRFAMVDGRPSFTYQLRNTDKVKDHAMGELRAKLAAACNLPVFVGMPPAGAR